MKTTIQVDDELLNDLKNLKGYYGTISYHRLLRNMVDIEVMELNSTTKEKEIEKLKKYNLFYE